jgi:FMN phosphatase YigB (HAD superfamily)
VTDHNLALFDLDDTLCRFPDAFSRWAAAFADEHGLEPETVVPWLTEEIARDEVYASYFDRVRTEFGLAPTVGALTAAFVEDVAAQYQVDDEVVTGIGALQDAGWLVGIVTNGPAQQEIKLQVTGLGKLVDGYVVSGIEGFDKPHPEIFRRAAQKCGSDRTAGWMVGDNPVADIGGARLAGLRSIWIELGRDWPHEAFRPDHVVDGPLAAIDILLEAGHSQSR